MSAHFPLIVVPISVRSFASPPPATGTTLTVAHRVMLVPLVCAYTGLLRPPPCCSLPASTLHPARKLAACEVRMLQADWGLGGSPVSNTTATVAPKSRRRPAVKLTALGFEVGLWRSSVLNEAMGLLLTIVLAASPAWGTLIASQAISAYAIPSRSMDQTLKVGDVVLAEKVSSLLRLPLERGDVVFFEPPDELVSIVADQGTRLGSRDRFVKRVAAVAGDVVQLDESGRGVVINGVKRERPALACADQPPPPPPRLAPPPRRPAALQPPAPPEVLGRVQQLLDEGRIDQGEAKALLREVARPERERAEGAAEAALSRGGMRIASAGTPNIYGESRAVDPEQIGVARVIPQGSVFVLGDCEGRSTDSRVWGPLETSRVMARPVVRIWPLDRIGAIEKEVDLNPFRRQALRFREALEEAIRRPAVLDNTCGVSGDWDCG